MLTTGAATAEAGTIQQGDDVAVGTCLAGRYSLERRIHGGAMGRLFVARDRILERMVAVKLARDAEQAGGRLRRPSLLDEARAMARVDHPNVVPLYDWGESSAGPFLVMPYVVGRNLFENLQAVDSLPVPRVVSLLRQAAAGLDAIHAAGLVHNDVKPENMMVTAGDRLVVCDLGIARAAVAPEAQFVGGTPLYVAPEVFLGRAVPATQRHLADVYALACSGYELLCGAPPHDVAGGFEQLMQVKCRGVAPPLVRHGVSLSPRCDVVLATAMALDPAQRFRSCGDFICELEWAIN